ncbi:MAG: MazG family protein, partial [Verrucomicrobia bacterium]|nr:MazG family protein [Verrucomicrobiota bacterium]MBU1857096.1 MazG family protein [Verrucomicrobiota bacterium]
MSTYTLQNLLDIMAKMRAEGGCPWDREQTLESLKQYLIEECYEVIDAIDSGRADKHADELGDLLLQVVFQAQIRSEQGLFAFEEVVDRICEKLIRRHPHVFGNTRVSGSPEVLKNWEAIK